MQPDQRIITRSPRVMRIIVGVRLSIRILSHVPAPWVPYGELMRIDKPTGIYLFYFPHLFGTLYAASLRRSEISSQDLLKINIILLAGTVFMRAAACAWNDNMDRGYDRQVRRCRFRPLARGALTPLQGHIFTGAMTVSALAFLYQLPTDCTLISIPSIALLVLYPFAKRFTDFPQLILGFQVAIGFFLGMAAVGYDFRTTTSTLWQALISFYLANICWTVVYDTVYAQQDVEDDAKAGVRSMAVRFKNGPRALLTLVAVLQVSCLACTGVFRSMSAGYFTIACGGTLGSMLWMLMTINLKQPAEFGLSIAGGLGFELF
ncbi:UbiA prenyltransferase [Glonium stellatum]|uniref:UbiA prenyltransferase n=1 Tax=Glonium stellatum TaxID=574774 RepID=A0A8E2EVP2_9PEZI|nr:UbiA prenyltransferase [Glonium stellatum]